jgi:hypothetical protein
VASVTRLASNSKWTPFNVDFGFQPNFGSVQGRDKWARLLASDYQKAALGILYSAPSKQNAAGSSPAGRASPLKRAPTND